MLQLSDLFVFWLYEIDLSMQHDRGSIRAATCQVDCRAKRLYYEQSATYIDGGQWRRRVDGGGTKHDCFNLRLL